MCRGDDTNKHTRSGTTHTQTGVPRRTHAHVQLRAYTRTLSLPCVRGRASREDPLLLLRLLPIPSSSSVRGTPDAAARSIRSLQERERTRREAGVEGERQGEEGENENRRRRGRVNE